MTHAKEIAGKLSQYIEQYAVYGGHAANVYRHEPREVGELSFALALGSAKKSKKVAETILEELGYSADYEWLDGLQSKTGKSVAVVIGTPPEGSESSPLYFYVASLPWVSKGVRRAQGTSHEIEGVKLPLIPVDDLIVAKTHALFLKPNSAQDIDDLSSIFQSETVLELPYIMGEFNLLELTLPRKLEGVIPEELAKYLG